LLQFKPIKKKPIISDWLFLVAGTGLSFTSLRMDLGGGLYLIAGKDQIYNFQGGYELVVDLWEKG
jgi:hypothetical protein